MSTTQTDLWTALAVMRGRAESLSEQLEQSERERVELKRKLQRLEDEKLIMTLEIGALKGQR
jgi:hypothetical protein